MLLPLLFIAIGLVLLVTGADALVSGASRIAQKSGIPPLIVGLTIVSIGTSAPEIVVSTTAALSGTTALALGNVVGSNIFNVLLILGITALILPLVVSVSIIRQEVPVMIGFSLLLMFFLRDAVLSSPESAFLLCLGLAYVLLLVFQAKRASKHGENVDVDLPDATGWSSKLPATVAIVIGLVALVGGARLLVGGATDIALAVGVDELVVGLTVVAIGTSLPELAASVAAVLRGERDLAIGNVVGSNIFSWSILYLLLTVLAAITSPVFPAIYQITVFALLPLTFIYLAATVIFALRRKQPQVQQGV